ncbi:MAG: cell division protein FtsL [Comamonadaceae bacterium]|nr:MAG: cell division protein FtsL [Comamonadaceae bacterium]
MARLQLILLIAVLATAMYLVHTQYRSRQLVTELDQARSEARRLDAESDVLQVEKRAQATPLRVEKLAKEQLQMRTPTPAITQYVSPDGSIAPGSALPAIVAASAPRRPASAGRAAAPKGASR